MKIMKIMKRMKDILADVCVPTITITTMHNYNKNILIKYGEITQNNSI